MKTFRKIKRLIKIPHDFIILGLIKFKFLLKYGSFDFFNDIDIEVNTACNRRCSYCPNSISERGLLKNNREMDVALYKKIIDELAELKFTGRLSPIFYGEPLLRNDLTELMEYTREKLPKVTIKMTSNGDYLTIEKYLELVEAGVDKFLITQHGQNISENMKKLLVYLKEHPEKKVKFIYSKFEKDTPLYNRGGLLKPNVVDYSPRCRKPHNPVIVDWEGNVILCCNDYFSEIKFGNLKTKNLLDIWNSDSYRNIRRELKKKIFNLEICKKCTRKAEAN